MESGAEKAPPFAITDTRPEGDYPDFRKERGTSGF